MATISFKTTKTQWKKVSGNKEVRMLILNRVHPTITETGTDLALFEWPYDYIEEAKEVKRELTKLFKKFGVRYDKNFFYIE